MMLEVGIMVSSSNSSFIGMTGLVLLEFSFLLGDASASGVFLCSKIAIQGSGLNLSILLACLTVASRYRYLWGDEARIVGCFM